jgi:TetR/AcrR family transcriptional regulator, transcriptional repressor for nem operon
MRYSTEHKEQTRKRILEAAARLFRERGYNGVGVDAVMAEVGLTAGGFYSHFASKEELFSEAVSNVLETRNSSLSKISSDQDGLIWLRNLINIYLSRSHRDMVGEGCPLPALTPDIARCSQETREKYERHFLVFLKEIESRMPAGQPPARERAMALMAHLIGSLTLARALNDDRLSTQVLKSSRQAAMRICEGSTEQDREQKQDR